MKRPELPAGASKMAEQQEGSMRFNNPEEEMLLEVHDSGNEREDIKDKDDVEEREGNKDRRKRGGSYERDLRRESRRFTPYSKDDRNRSSRHERGKECRIYVSNLPYNTKWQDIKDFFKKGT